MVSASSAPDGDSETIPDRIVFSRLDFEGRQASLLSWRRHFLTG